MTKTTQLLDYSTIFKLGEWPEWLIELLEQRHWMKWCAFNLYMRWSLK